MRVALENSFDPARRRLADRWLLLLALCLTGYALAGRGFAYLGLPPIFIGEICLGCGLVVFLMTRGWMRVMQVGAAVAVIPLAVWGFIRLVPYIGEYGIEAIRDAVVWGYAAFALVVASLIVANPARLPRLLGYYRTFTKVFLLCIPVSFLLYRFGRNALPNWPWNPTPIIQIKEGDALVHLAGILAFWMADPKRAVRWGWAILLTLDMAMMGVIDRAGLVAFAAVLILCLVAKPLHGAAWRTIGMLILGAALLWGSQINIEVPGGKGRNISWEQFVDSFTSVVGQSKNAGSESNKEWRLQWWTKIVGYTFDGPYFWTGKGFGINLADDDGFQVNADKSLRSPHSVHMTMLARTGVPGLALWVIMHVTWLFGLFDAYLRSRRRGQQRWAGAFLFLLAYYAAFIINGSFDVFIEGPMGGIWFWTIFGTGVGALWVWRYAPQTLSDDAEDLTHAFPVINEGPGRAQFLPAAGGRGRRLPIGAGASGIAGS